MHWFSPACLSRSYAAISVACLSRSYAAISVSAAELILMGVASEASGSEASEASIMVDRERRASGEQRRIPGTAAQERSAWHRLILGDESPWVPVGATG